jgi:predicted transcriptional regulator
MRTHFNRFLDYIKASAALHQFQRQTDGDGFIVAEGGDYDIARIGIIKTTSNQFMIPLTKDQKQIIKVFRSLEKRAYSVSEIEPLLNLSQKWIYVNLNRLSGCGVLKKDSIKKENSDKRIMVYSYIDLIELNFPEWKNIDEYCRNHTIATNHTIGTDSTIRTNTSNLEVEEEAIVGNEAIVQEFQPMTAPIHHKCKTCGESPCLFEDAQGRFYCSQECIPVKSK